MPWHLPWYDWQFYVVTAVAAAGAWNLLRQFLGQRGTASPCGSCAVGAAACAKKPSPVRIDASVRERSPRRRPDLPR